MGKKKNLGQDQERPRQVFLHDDHKRPTNRREFLAAGLIGFSGYVMAPSILSILARPSFALGASNNACDSASGVQLPSFITINLAGGAALAGNYIALDQGGQMLPSYDLVGLGQAPPIEREFGNVAFAGAPADSTRLAAQLLAGIRATASRATLDRTSFLAVCVPLQDDSGNNKIDISGMVTAAGLSGELLPRLGSQETVTGVRQEPAVVRPPAPLVVNNINDILGALAPAGALASRLNVSQRQNLLRLVNNLSSSQARTLAKPNSSSGQTLSRLIQCVTDKNVQLSTAANPGVDPRLDQSIDVAGLWQMTTGGTLFGRGQNDRLFMGTMVYNALKGNAGTVGIDIGGYDYHGNSRQGLTDPRDFDAGQLIGKVLETASLMGKKVFIQITSDGSVGTPSGSDINANFESDRGNGGQSWVLAFNPAGRPALKNANSYQLGYFNKGQGAVDQSDVGSAEKAAKAIFANYLQFAGQTALYPKITNDQPVAGELDRLIKFA